MDVKKVRNSFIFLEKKERKSEMFEKYYIEFQEIKNGGKYIFFRTIF